MTNCPNCGAPVRRGYSKCEYCDTPYDGADSPVLYADNRPVHIEYQAPSGMTPDFLAQQVCESIQNRIHRIESQINVSNTVDWQRRMLEQSVNVFQRAACSISEPVVEYNKAAKADYEMMKKVEHTCLDTLLPFMFAILSTLIIPTIISYFCR